MKIHSALILIVVSITVSTPVYSDQRDTRLDDLFLRLKTTKNQRMAHLISEDIWHLWSRYDDPKVNQLFRHGESAMFKEDYQTALKDFTHIIEMAPDYAEAWNKRATAYYQAGFYQESLKDIKQTLSLEPRHFGAVTGRGLCYLKLDNWQLALSSFEQALEINPWLARVRENIKKLKGAIKQSI